MSPKKSTSSVFAEKKGSPFRSRKPKTVTKPLPLRNVRSAILKSACEALVNAGVPNAEAVANSKLSSLEHVFYTAFKGRHEETEMEHVTTRTIRYVNDALAAVRAAAVS